MESIAYELGQEIDDKLQRQYKFEMSAAQYLALIRVLTFPRTSDKRLALQSELISLTPNVLLHRVRYIDSLIDLFGMIQKRSKQ